MVSCATPRVPTPAPPRLAPEHLQELLQQRTEYWYNYQASASIRIEGSQGKFRVQAVLLANPPSRMRLEASNLWGQLIWVLVLNGQQANFWVPSEKTLYKAARGESILEHFLGSPVPPEIFIYSFIGCVPASQLADHALTLVPNGDAWLGTSRSASDQWLFNWSFNAHPLALKSLKALQGEAAMGYDVRFQPAIPSEPAAKPERITISSKNWELEATLKQLDRPSGFSPSVFELPTIAGSRIVDLDEVPRRQPSLTN